jgi:hypothetical protein
MELKREEERCGFFLFSDLKTRLTCEEFEGMKELQDEVKGHLVRSLPRQRDEYTTTGPGD